MVIKSTSPVALIIQAVSPLLITKVPPWPVDRFGSVRCLIARQDVAGCKRTQGLWLFAFLKAGDFTLLSQENCRDTLA
jgi:hypothetical protein